MKGGGMIPIRCCRSRRIHPSIGRRTVNISKQWRQECQNAWVRLGILLVFPRFGRARKLLMTKEAGEISFRTDWPEEARPCAARGSTEVEVSDIVFGRPQVSS
jgi:hypothetical protein